MSRIFTITLSVLFVSLGYAQRYGWRADDTNPMWPWVIILVIAAFVYFYFKAGVDYYKHINYLKRKSKIGPQKEYAFMELSRLSSYKKKYKKALFYIDEGLKISPDNQGLILWKAKIIHMKGQRDEAFELFLHSISSEYYSAPIKEIDAYYNNTIDLTNKQRKELLDKCCTVISDSKETGRDLDMEEEIENLDNLIMVCEKINQLNPSDEIKESINGLKELYIEKKGTI